MSLLPKSEAGRKATAMVLWASITMTIGWGFMRFTTPTDEQLYERLSPELRRQFDREKKKRREDNDKSLQQMFDNRNLDRPAWRTDMPQESRQETAQGKQMVPMSVDSGEKVPVQDRPVRR